MPPNLNSDGKVTSAPATLPVDLDKQLDRCTAMDQNFEDKSFHIGILAETLEFIAQHTVSIANPASSCVVTAIALVAPGGQKELRDEKQSARQWCQRYFLNADADSVAVTTGEAGYQELLENSNVDAVYVALPFAQREDYVPRALKAGKHVLVDNPVCTTVPEYLELLELARTVKKNVQDTTMFIHHHRVNEFLSCVLDEKNFGEIKSVHQTLLVKETMPDPAIVMANPKWREQGCVATLARYCIMFGLVIFDHVGLKVQSIQATKATADHHGSIYEVVCRLGFEKGRSVIIDCGYIGGKSHRQHVEVEATSRSASMINYVYPINSLASYRLYETSTAKAVVSGDSIDIEAGPPQAVMMWRSFAEISQLADQGGANVKNDAITIDSIGGLNHVLVETLNVITGLMTSIAHEGAEIKLEPVKLPVW